MANFTHIIFDLDGTLTDNTQGIDDSVRFALKQMQIDDYPEDYLDTFVGPPLQWGFRNLFGLNERNTLLAVEHFREYYSENGWHENEPYPGVSEMLEELHSQGKKLYIATSKLEKYAVKIVEHFGFDKYIDQLIGADYSGKKSNKSLIIGNLLESQRLSPSKAIVMVGDTVFDIEGGKENGLTTVAVSYGFGKVEALKNSNPDFFVESVAELFEVLG